MFSIGQNIVYPMHGAGVVEAIESKEIGGKAPDYYKVRIFNGNINLLVPVDNAGGVKMRDVVTDEIANDIITCLGTDAVPRLRMGVGAKPHPDFDMADWVLSNFTKNEMDLLMNCFDDAFAGMEKLFDGDLDTAMQICNSHAPAEK